MKSKLMAVDLGTSFIKVGVYDTQSNCVGYAVQPVREERPNAGMFIQYGNEIFQSVVVCIKSAAESLGIQAGDIEAIAFTGQMAGFMGVDKDWNDITTWSCSLDSRYTPFTKQMLKDHADLLLEESGTNYPVMAPKIKWFEHDFPEENKKIAKYLMISGYVLGRLGNVPVENAVIHRSYLQWTGLADIRNDRWSEKICAALNIDISRLPQIVQATDICGRLSKEMAALCGLKSGIPLVAGSGDKPAGCVGAGVVEAGDAILEAASYAGLSCCVESYKPDYEKRRIDIIPSAIPGQYYCHNFLAGSGIALDWYIDNFYEGIAKNDAFLEMERKIAEVSPGSQGLLAIGHLSGRAMPFDGNLRGMWMNFDLTHKKEHFYRALIESYSYEFALTFNRIDQLYPEYNIGNVNIIGGGAKSKVWNQINADVCRRSFATLNREDVALWGACILAGNAVGIFHDIKETARKFVQVKDRYTPNIRQYEKYEKYIDLYEEYAAGLHNNFKKLQSGGY
jgi:xylulokinase